MENGDSRIRRSSRSRRDARRDRNTTSTRMKSDKGQGASRRGWPAPGTKVYRVAKTRHRRRRGDPPPRITTLFDRGSSGTHPLSRTRPRGARERELVAEVGVGTIAAGVAKHTRMRAIPAPKAARGLAAHVADP